MITVKRYLINKIFSKRYITKKFENHWARGQMCPGHYLQSMTVKVN